MVPDVPQRDPPRRVQFSLRSLILFTTACSVLAAVFHWIGLSPLTGLLISLLLSASAVAALLLVLSAPDASDDENDEWT